MVESAGTSADGPWLSGVEGALEESRTKRLHQLLKRLGQAVHGSVVQSEEVRECLEELHEDGWTAVMLLESSLVCRDGGGLTSKEARLHIHVDPTEQDAPYRLDAGETGPSLRSVAFFFSVRSTELLWHLSSHGSSGPCLQSGPAASLIGFGQHCYRAPLPARKCRSTV